MKIRRGDNILVRLTAGDDAALGSRWFTAQDRDGDDITVCREDVVSVEPAPLPEEPPVYSLVQIEGYSVYRRWPQGWVRIGVMSPEGAISWEEIVDRAGDSLQILVAKAEESE